MSEPIVYCIIGVNESNTIRYPVCFRTTRQEAKELVDILYAQGEELLAFIQESATIYANATSALMDSLASNQRNPSKEKAITDAHHTRIMNYRANSLLDTNASNQGRSSYLIWPFPEDPRHSVSREY